MRLPLIKYANAVLTIIIVPLTLSPLCFLLIVRLGVYIVNLCLLFLQAHRDTDRFSETSGVQLEKTNRGRFHYRLVVFSQLKSKVDNILVKNETLRISLNTDGAPVASKSHTYPSHSQTSRLLTSSLSSGVPVPRA